MVCKGGEIKVQFHETILGKRFFEHQLPNLIRQLARIADALEEANESKEKEQNDNESCN